MTGQDQPGPVALSTSPEDAVHGRVDIADRVVSKIAAQAAVELEHVGAAAPRVLGRSLDGLSSRHTDLDSVPKCDATVDGDHAYLAMTVSIRWPQSVPDTCARLREHVGARVLQLTGLTVNEVDLTVDSLVTEPLRPTARVQ